MSKVEDRSDGRPVASENVCNHDVWFGASSYCDIVLPAPATWRDRSVVCSNRTNSSILPQWLVNEVEKDFVLANAFSLQPCGTTGLRWSFGILLNLPPVTI